MRFRWRLRLCVGLVLLALSLCSSLIPYTRPIGFSKLLSRGRPKQIRWSHGTVKDSPSATSPSSLSDTKGTNDFEQQKKGYQFGDITRSLAKRARGRVEKLTGKKYEFGDLTKYLDQQAKGKVANITGKDSYEFGDLTKWADQAAKEKVANFTGKDNASYEYQFGDISREILRRIQSGEYELQDVFLALRILLSAGASMTPIASVLPVKWLLELVNLGLAQDVGNRLVGILASSLDERMKLALTGDSKYQLGDMTKRKLLESIVKFTGKDKYEFGDISRRISSIAASSSADATNSGSSETRMKEQRSIEVSDDVLLLLEDWDSRLALHDATRQEEKYQGGDDS